MILEFKKQPWRLYVLLVILLSLSIGLVSVSDLMINSTHGISFGNGPINWANGTEASEQSLVIKNLRYQQRIAKRTRPKKWSDADEINYQARKRIITAINDRHFAHANQIVYQTEKQNPLIFKQDSLILNEFVQDTYPGLYMSFYADKYMAQHRLNFILDIQGFSSVLNGFLRSIGYSAGESEALAKYLPMGIICGAITVLMLILFKDKREHTSELLNVAPMHQTYQQLIRAGVTILIMNLVVAGTALLIVVGLALFTGHSLGSLQFPFVTVILSKYVVYPLWMILGQYLILCNLWFVLLASIAFFAITVTDNLLVGGGIASLVAFAGPLHLLAIVPPFIARLLPGFYLSFVQITLHVKVFTDIRLRSIIMVFVCWSLLFIVLGILMPQIRRWRVLRLIRE